MCLNGKSCLSQPKKNSMSGSAVAEVGAGERFLHEAFLYSSDEEFMATAAPFIRDSIAADEPILVMLSAAKIEALRSHTVHNSG